MARNKTTRPSKTANSPVNYPGYQPDTKTEKNQSPSPNVSRYADKFDNRTPEQKEQQRLADLLNETEMSAADFNEIAELSYQKIDLLNARIDNVAELVKQETINIKLDFPYDEQAKKLIGSGTITNDNVECLLKISNASHLQTEYANNPKASGTDLLDKAFSEDKIAEAFPTSFKNLIIMLLMIFIEVVVKMLLKTICTVVTTVITGIFKPITSSHLLSFLDIIVDDIIVLLCKTINIVGEVILFWVKGVRVCGKDQARDPFNFRAMVDEAYDAAYNENDFPGVIKDNPKRCNDPKYVPTTAEKIMADQILQRGVEQELGANVASINRNPKSNIGGTKYPLTRLVNLRKGQNEMKTLTVTAKGMSQRNSPSPGIFIADKASAHMIGFLININSFAQQLDAKVTGILQLEFLNANAKAWVCCIVRLLYIMIPRIQYAHNIKKLPKEDRKKAKYKEAVLQKAWKDENAVRENLDMFGLTDSPSNEKLDAEKKASFNEYKKGNLELEDLSGNKAYQETIKWVKMLDAVIILITSNMSFSIQMNFKKIFSADFIMAVLKTGLSESLSYLTTFMQFYVSEKMFLPLEKATREVPELALAIKNCEPFNWFFNSLKCGMQDMFIKIHEILATMHQDGENYVNGIEMAVSITTNQSTLGLFHNLLAMLIKWDQALINFCSLNRIQLPEERDAFIFKLKREMETDVDKLIKDVSTDNAKAKADLSRSTIPKAAAPVYSSTINLNPTGRNVYISNSDNNPLIEDRATFHENLYRAVNDPTFEPEVGIVAPNSPEEELKQVLSGCGDQFKALLRDRENDILNIQKSFFNNTN